MLFQPGCFAFSSVHEPWSTSMASKTSYPSSSSHSSTQLLIYALILHSRTILELLTCVHLPSPSRQKVPKGRRAYLTQVRHRTALGKYWSRHKLVLQSHFLFSLLVDPAWQLLSLSYNWNHIILNQEQGVGVGGGFVPSAKHHGKRKSPVVGVRGNNAAINSWDVQWGSYNSSGPHFRLQNEDISKAPSSPSGSNILCKSLWGWIQETDFQIDWAVWHYCIEN